MPLSIPLIPKALFNNISDMSITDIAYVVGSSLFGSDISPKNINAIVKETFNFDIPLVRLSDHTYVLELFHGPTGTFKDVGARFLSRVIQNYLGSSSLKPGPVNMLVATQGDTGLAVAKAFADVRGVNLFIFHPSQTPIKYPSARMNSMGDNIISVEVRGSLDDCQQLVRQAYEDEDLNKRLNLTSANSINIARLLPQTIFYFYSYARLKAVGEAAENMTVAMPCGNLGNLTAALFARLMGLPIKRIMAAGRGGQRLWGQISEGILSVNNFNQRALNTNLSRINVLMQRTPSLSDCLNCYSYSEEDTNSQIALMYATNHYLMGRNTAMASRAMMEYRRPDEVGVFLATDNPEMYADQINSIVGTKLRSHEHSGRRTESKERFAPLSPTLPAVKHFILDHIK